MKNSEWKNQIAFEFFKNSYENSFSVDVFTLKKNITDNNDPKNCHRSEFLKNSDQVNQMSLEFFKNSYENFFSYIVFKVEKI